MGLLTKNMDSLGRLPDKLGSTLGCGKIDDIKGDSTVRHLLAGDDLYLVTRRKEGRTEDHYR